MVATLSKMTPLGALAPGFNLPDTEGKIVSIDDFRKSKALLVIFMCNHCPFVRHVLRALVKLAAEYQAKDVAVVGISSNDIEDYPEDNPEMMGKLVTEAQITFPYLFDEDQSVAKAYMAACTPDFFLFDENRRLVYRGQMDDSRPGNNIPVTGKDLRLALDAVLAGKKVSSIQKPSMGCSIKWKPGSQA
ncbi:MAG: thioredoxin family protein [Sedimentisphaerales bacterium]|nr:thioredoxin family protein [Sedimentisphaerales bacterium]